MNVVEAIKDKKDINKLKKCLAPRDRLMFVLGINSGLRISDILSLKVRDVIDENGKPKDRLILVEQKTGKRKSFPFNKAIISELKKLEYKSLDDYLFPSQKGGPISRVQAYRVLNEAAKRAGLPYQIGTHSLRKTFGYHAYKAGTPVSVIQNLLNHSSEKVTLRYIGITQEVLDDVYVNINL
jgi:integrase